RCCRRMRCSRGWRPRGGQWGQPLEVVVLSVSHLLVVGLEPLIELCDGSVEVAVPFHGREGVLYADLVRGQFANVEVAFFGLGSHAHYRASFSLLIWNPPQTMRWPSCSRMTTGAAVYPAAFASSRISGCWSRGFST